MKIQKKKHNLQKTDEELMGSSINETELSKNSNLYVLGQLKLHGTRHLIQCLEQPRHQDFLIQCLNLMNLSRVSNPQKTGFK